MKWLRKTEKIQLFKNYKKFKTTENLKIIKIHIKNAILQAWLLFVVGRWIQRSVDDNEPIYGQKEVLNDQMVPGNDVNSAGEFQRPFAVFPSDELVEGELEDGKQLEEVGKGNGQHDTVEDASTQFLVHQKDLKINFVDFFWHFKY